MPLPWARMDTALASHDKILALLNDSSSKRWQAAFSYPCGIGWCAEHGTDGHIPATALPFIHATKATAELLVKYRLWTPEDGGWFMPNFPVRQELSFVTEAKLAAKRLGGIKGNCIRHHGPDCGCWQNAA